jgi:membrane protease YdiL (CAAX protease family)
MLNKNWLLVGTSSALALVGAVASILMHGPNLFLHPKPILELSTWMREGCSVAVAVGFALPVVFLSNIASKRTRWGRRLHQDLRPVALQLSPSMILAMAVLSGLGEELLFRSFLTPWVGVVPQAIVFGLVHQMPGPSRWVWVIWATGAGLAFGAMYSLFGTLTGPVLAHALINGLNLRFLRDFDPSTGRLFHEHQNDRPSHRSPLG